MAPWRLIAPVGGPQSDRPACWLGETMEPSVSVPSEKPTSPAAVQAAEPRTARSASYAPSRRVGHGLFVLPLNHSSPCASAPIESLAISTAPALYSRSTHVASVSGTRFWNGSAPQVVENALGVEQVLHAERNPVQRPAIVPRADFHVRGRRLLERLVLGERHQAEQLGRVLLHPRQVHPGEVGGGHRARAHQRRQFADAPEGQVFQIRGALASRRLGRSVSKRCGPLPGCGPAARGGTRMPARYRTARPILRSAS